MADPCCGRRLDHGPYGRLKWIDPLTVKPDYSGVRLREEAPIRKLVWAAQVGLAGLVCIAGCARAQYVEQACDVDPKGGYIAIVLVRKDRTEDAHARKYVVSFDQTGMVVPFPPLP